MTELPPCGIYRTTGDVAGIPAGRLVYFHNHGDPGPGLYLPESWKGNRVNWQKRGHTLPEPAAVRWLEPLPAEGFYRVTEDFYCCEKQCRRFEPDLLVQLGYTAQAQPILFVPEIVDGMLAVPERGAPIEASCFQRLKALKLASSQRQQVH